MKLTATLIAIVVGSIGYCSWWLWHEDPFVKRLR